MFYYKTTQLFLINFLVCIDDHVYTFDKPFMAKLIDFDILALRTNLYSLIQSELKKINMSTYLWDMKDEPL